MAQQQVKQSHVSRRTILRSVGGGAALAGVALATGVNARGVRAEAGQKMEGTWIVTVMPAAGGALRSMATYSPDGTYISSALPFAPAPPGLGVARVHVSPSFGEWYRIGDRTFAATFMTLVADEGGAFVAVQKVSNTITLDEGGNSLTSQFQATYTAPDGTVLFEFSGTTQASRIRVEPL